MFYSNKFVFTFTSWNRDIADNVLAQEMVSLLTYCHRYVIQPRSIIEVDWGPISYSVVLSIDVILSMVLGFGRVQPTNNQQQ